MKTSIIFAIILLPIILLAQATDLFISEYIEGSSHNKAIEIFNGTGDIVDLSDYSLEKDVNGNGVFNNTYNYSGTLENDDVFVLANSQADAAILNEADDTNNGVINYNGNDQVRLVKNGVEIDHLGFPGGDDFAVNTTLVRLPDVISPTTNYDEAEWESHPQNYFDNLGFHIFSGTTTPTIVVTSPNGGENWEQGSNHNITWTSINFDENVQIELAMVNRSREVLVASTENDGTWEWAIPADLMTSDDYVIIISDAVDNDPFDESDNTFSIIEPIPVTPYTIYEIQYSTTGPSPLEGELVQTSGVVTAIFENYFFIQDGAGAWNGIVVYPIQDVELGHEIEIIAYVAEYEGKTELTDVVQITDLGLSDMPQPTTISTAQIASTEDYESVLVNAQNVIVTSEPNSYGEWEIDDSSGACMVGSLGDYTYEPVLNDEIFSINGIVNYSYGNFILEPRDDFDISLEGLIIAPLELNFMTLSNCLDGIEFSIVNLSNLAIEITDIEDSGIFPECENQWNIVDFNLPLPYSIASEESLSFNVVVQLPVNFDRNIVSDTLQIEAETGTTDIILNFDTDINTNVDNDLLSSKVNLSNYPNPFNPSTTISFTQPNDHIEDLKIEIYNIRGQKIEEISIDNTVNSSSHHVTWDAKKSTSGVYFYKLVSEEKQIATKKMLLMK